MPTLPDDGTVDIEALIVDRYLDTLLSGADAGGHDAPAQDPAPDPMLRTAAEVLRRSLVRVHPSFQFEERLSARLSALAASDGGGSRAGSLIPFRPLRSGGSGDASPGGRVDRDDASGELAEVPAGRRAAAVRPLLIGGAITSAALSLAGVAWVARRAVRTPGLTELEGLL